MNTVTSASGMIPPSAQQELASRALRVLDQSPNGVVMLEPLRAADQSVCDFRVTYCNQAARQAYEADKPLEPGMLLTEIYPNTHQGGLFEWYVAVLASGITAEGEQFYAENGLWIHYSIIRQDDSLVMTFRVITETRRLQTEVDRQTDLLRAVITNQPTGIVLVEAVRDEGRRIVDLRYLLTNEVNARLVNMSVAEMMGQTVLSLFPGYETVELYQRLCQVIETGRTQRYSFYYDMYGIRAWFDATIVKQHDGALLTFLDITATKQTELERQEQASLLHRVINTSLNALVVHRAMRNQEGAIVDFQITLANQVGIEWLQMPAALLYAHSMSVNVPGFTQGAIFRHYQQVIETGEPYHFERHIRDKWFDFVAARFGDGVVVSATDVTNLRESQQQQQVINDELRRSNENLQQFAYVASHDLQEPLRKIVAFSDILNQQFGHTLGPEGTDLLKRMQSAAGRMSVLIRDLLAYSRIASQRNPFRPVSLPELLEIVIDDLDVTIQESDAAITVGDLPVLTGDRVQLQQLFQNLLTNALKFRRSDPETGELVKPVVSVTAQVLTGHALPEPVRRLAVDSRLTFCEISVTDNGVGFDEKYLDRIFQMFQRLHSRANYTGTGVGLAICQRVVEQHGGAITAASKPGEGATFRVYLPMQTKPGRKEAV